MDEALDRLPGGFLSFGDDSVLISTNATMRAMMGLRPNDVEGRHVESLLTVPSRIFYQTHVFPLLKMKGRLEEVYLSMLGKQGDQIPVLINASCFQAGGKNVYECLVVAMSRRDEYEDEILRAKHAAEQATLDREVMHQSLLAANAALEAQRHLLADRNVELETLKDSLERRIESRTSELRETLAEIEAINYSIAHDLQAPLRSIMTTSSLLLEEAGQNLQEEHRTMLTRQKRSAGKLASLLEDLLKLSRYRVRPIQKQTLDLSELADEAVRTALDAQKRSDFELIIERGVLGFGDRGMLYTALQNLFENAVKYSPQGGELRFGTVENARELVCFVSDQGIGIDEVYTERIFQPFERLHRDEDFPGNGVGLASVDRIVRRHGGRIWFESEIGRGTTFFFTLPKG